MSQKSTVRTTILSNLGACLEYYDYVLYAMLSVYIADVFFPKSDQQIQAIQSILLFVVGTFARFCGSIVFGIIGDKFGRRQSMTTSIMLMGFATMIMGALPTYVSFGIIATMLLTLCRFAQGMAFGAEVPSAAIFITESTSKGSKALNIGILNASISMGSVLASLVIFIMTSVFTNQEMLDFGWRIPLLLGGMLGIAGFILRKNIPESPEFLKSKERQKQSEEVKFSFLERSTLIKGIGGIVTMMLPASFIITNIYFPMLLSKFFNYTVNDISFYITISLIVAVKANILLGYFIDRYGIKSMLFASIVFFVLFYAPLLIYMNKSAENIALQTHLYLLCFLIIYQVLTVVAFNICVSKTLELFPTKIKNTAFAMVYNLASFIASFIPIILVKYNNPLLLLVMPIVIGWCAALVSWITTSISSYCK